MTGNKKLTNRRSGFTLIEVLVVTLVIGILAGLVIGISGLTQSKGAESDTLTIMHRMAFSLDEFRDLYGRYPTVEEYNDSKYDDLGFLRTNGVEDVSFEDSWDQDFEYTLVSRYQYILKSRGLDGFWDTADDLVLGE